MGDENASEFEAAPERKKSWSELPQDALALDSMDATPLGGTSSPRSLGDNSDERWTPSFAGHSAPHTPPSGGDDDGESSPKPSSARRQRPGEDPQDEHEPLPLPKKNVRLTKQRVSATFLSDEETANQPIKSIQLSIPSTERLDDSSTSSDEDGRNSEEWRPAPSSARRQSFFESDSSSGDESPRASPTKVADDVLPAQTCNDEAEVAQADHTSQSVQAQAEIARAAQVTATAQAEADEAEAARTIQIAQSVHVHAAPLQAGRSDFVQAQAEATLSSARILQPPEPAVLEVTTAKADSASSSQASTTGEFASSAPSSVAGSSAWLLKEPAMLRQQLEELEEQQRHIHLGLTQALEFERRSRAEELSRCQAISAELAEALAEERRRHSEEIVERERWLEKQLQAYESRWRSEVEALQAELHLLRQASASTPMKDQELCSQDREEVAQYVSNRITEVAESLSKQVQERSFDNGKDIPMDPATSSKSVRFGQKLITEPEWKRKGRRCLVQGLEDGSLAASLSGFADVKIPPFVNVKQADPASGVSTTSASTHKTEGTSQMEVPEIPRLLIPTEPVTRSACAEATETSLRLPSAQDSRLLPAPVQPQSLWVPTLRPTGQLTPPSSGLLSPVSSNAPSSPMRWQAHQHMSMTHANHCCPVHSQAWLAGAPPWQWSGEAASGVAPAGPALGHLMAAGGSTGSRLLLPTEARSAVRQPSPGRPAQALLAPEPQMCHRHLQPSPRPGRTSQRLHPSDAHPSHRQLSPSHPSQMVLPPETQACARHRQASPSQPSNMVLLPEGPMLCANYRHRFLQEDDSRSAGLVRSRPLLAPHAQSFSSLSSQATSLQTEAPAFPAPRATSWQTDAPALPAPRVVQPEDYLLTGTMPSAMLPGDRVRQRVQQVMVGSRSPSAPILSRSAMAAEAIGPRSLQAHGVQLAG